MIINNKSVRGIYLYDSSVTYEKNDFVVFGNRLYIVTSKEVTGVIPVESDTEHYRLYLSENSATLDEIVEYITSDGKDSSIGSKLVTVSDLCNILSKYSGGINYEGKITNRISPDNTIITSDYFGNEVEKKYDSSVNPLDIILEQPELNNAVFYISGEIAQGIVPESSDTLILRQYTYTSGENSIRLQEIIDFSLGNISVRYATKNNNITGSTYTGTTSWKSSYQKSRDIDNLIDLKNKYYQKVNQLVLQNKVLENNYRYSSVKIPEPRVEDSGSIVYTYSYGTKTGSSYPNIYVDDSTTSLVSTLYFKGSPFTGDDQDTIPSVGSIILDLISLLGGTDGEIKFSIPDLSDYNTYVVFKTSRETNSNTGESTKVLKVILYYSGSGSVTLDGFYIKKSLNSEFVKISGNYDLKTQKKGSDRGLTEIEINSGSEKLDFSNSLTYDRYIIGFTVNKDGTGSIPVKASDFSSDQHYYFMINLNLKHSITNEHGFYSGNITKSISMLVDLYEYMNDDKYSVKQDVVFRGSNMSYIAEVIVGFERVSALSGSGIEAVITIKSGSFSNWSSVSAPNLESTYFCQSINYIGTYDIEATPTIDVSSGEAVFYNNIV